MTTSVGSKTHFDVTNNVSIAQPKERVENFLSVSYAPENEIGQSEGQEENFFSFSQTQEKEKENIKDKINSVSTKTIKEKTSLSGSQSDSEDEDPSDENCEAYPTKSRSNSCPAVAQSADSMPSAAKSTSSSTEVSKIERQPRSLSASSSSYAHPFDVDVRGKHMKTEVKRSKEFKAEVDFLYANYNHLKAQRYFQEESQGLIEQMILQVKEINKKLHDDIDRQLSSHGNYYKAATQLNTGFTTFCKHLCNFYDEMQKLHQALDDDIIKQHEPFCHQLRDYLANEKSSIETIKGLGESSFLKLLRENKDILDSVIRKHIGSKYLLIKSSHEILNAKKTHEQDSEKGNHKNQALAYLLIIPHHLEEEKWQLEELYSQIKSRIKMRQKLDSTAEYAGKEMISIWLKTIDKWCRKLVPHDQ